MNYEELLKKYIRLVVINEYDCDTLGHAHHVAGNSGLTEEEYDYLQKLSEEVTA
jgi:hypothetical protein